jgi:hypothetical protein
MAFIVDQKYVQYIKRKSPEVTKLPVILTENPNMKTKNAKCKILKYNKPREYKIVFAGSFYAHNKNKSADIENIIDHELAHIKYPYTHGLGFRRLAKKLGASKRYQLPR